MSSLACQTINDERTRVDSAIPEEDDKKKNHKRSTTTQVNFQNNHEIYKQTQIMLKILHNTILNVTIHLKKTFNQIKKENKKADKSKAITHSYKQVHLFINENNKDFIIQTIIGFNLNKFVSITDDSVSDASILWAKGERML